MNRREFLWGMLLGGGVGIGASFLAMEYAPYLGRFLGLEKNIGVVVVDQTTKCHDIPLLFQRAEKLHVNGSSDVHYYVEASKEDGIKQLRELARTSDKEEGFMYINNGRRQYWFEIGTNQQLTQVSLDFSLFYTEVSSFCFDQRLEVQSFHIHPDRAREGKTIYSTQVSSYNLEAELSHESKFSPSAADLFIHASLKRSFDNEVNRRNGVVVSPSGVVTSKGYFLIEVSGELYSRIVDGINNDKVGKFLAILQNAQAQVFNRAVVENSSRSRKPKSLDLGDILDAYKNHPLFKDVTVTYSEFDKSFPYGREGEE